jgi:hypothetical protein
VSNLVDHAIRELRLCGQYDEDPSYATTIINAIAVFASYGHSGGSAAVATYHINELLRFKTLSPLTDDPEEWTYHDEKTWGAPGGIYQSVRNPACFSEDGGKTYYDVDDKTKPKTRYNTQPHVKSEQTPELDPPVGQE